MEKCIIFQIFFYLIYNGTAKTPLHASLIKSTHDTRWSQLTLCMNHNDLEKIDLYWAERTIHAAAGSSAPVPLIVADKVTV